MSVKREYRRAAARRTSRPSATALFYYRAILPIAGKGSSDWRYAWIPIVGPVIGGVIGAWAYRLLYT